MTPAGSIQILMGAPARTKGACASDCAKGRGGWQKTNGDGEDRMQGKKVKEKGEMALVVVCVCVFRGLGV